MASTRPRRGPLRRALEVTVKASPTLARPEHAAIVALARSLADAMDQADTTSSHMSAAYLSALKDLSRATAAAPEPAKTGGLASVSNVPRPSAA